MTAPTTPVYIGRIGKTGLRFFRAPSGRLETPWVAADDLCNAMRLSPDIKRELLDKAGGSAPIPTSGTVAVVHALTAQNIIRSATEAGLLARSFEAAFRAVAEAATSHMVAGMSAGELFDGMLRMARAADERRSQTTHHGASAD